MICQRCGLCCTFMVPIRIGDNVVLKPDGVYCPHLSFDGTLAQCAVHGEPWYPDTPCNVYGNPDCDPDFEIKRGRPCPVGKLMQQKGGMQAQRPGTQWVKVDGLEVVGQWGDL